MVVWIVLGVYGAASMVAFLAFALDKRAARLGRRRIPERTLHMIELLGGWPGALAAAYIVRHKNRKARYMAALIGIAVLHLGVWGAVWWMR